LPHFDRHNGQTAKSRGLTYNRVKSHRQKTKRDCNAASVSQSLPENREQSIDTPPPLPLRQAAKIEEEEEEVRNLVKTLRADPYGVNDAATAVEQATTSGCTVDELRAIATQWALAGKWSSAQLWHRISLAMPGESPVAHWPQPDASKQQTSRRGTGDPETDRANQEFLQRRERTRRANGTQTQTPESLAAS